MIMSVTSSKSLDELDQDLRKQSSVTNFGNKGIPLERECR